LQPTTRQICRASSHRDRDDENDELVLTHLLYRLPIWLSSPFSTTKSLKD
jgi:hypothetical protein